MLYRVIVSKTQWIEVTLLAEDEDQAAHAALEAADDEPVLATELRVAEVFEEDEAHLINEHPMRKGWVS